VTQAFPIALFQHPLLLTLRAFHVLFGTDRKPFHCFTTWILTLMKEMLHLITEPLKRAPFPNEQTLRQCTTTAHMASHAPSGMAGTTSLRATSMPAGILPPDLLRMASSLSWTCDCTALFWRSHLYLSAARKSCHCSDMLTWVAQCPTARSNLLTGQEVMALSCIYRGGSGWMLGKTSLNEW